MMLDFQHGENLIERNAFLGKFLNHLLDNVSVGHIGLKIVLVLHNVDGNAKTRRTERMRASSEKQGYNATQRERVAGLRVMQFFFALR